MSAKPDNTVALPDLRKAGGFATRRAAASFLGVAENTVYRWESGRSRIPDHVVRLLELEATIRGLAQQAEVRSDTSNRKLGLLIRNAIRLTRLQGGRTQEDLASAASTSRSGIAHLERGRGEPSGQLLAAVLKALYPDPEASLNAIPAIGAAISDLDQDGFRALFVLLLSYGLIGDFALPVRRRRPTTKRAPGEDLTSLQPRLF